MLNALGSTVRTYPIPAHATNATLDLTGLAPGLYVFAVARPRASLVVSKHLLSLQSRLNRADSFQIRTGKGFLWVKLPTSYPRAGLPRLQHKVQPLLRRGYAHFIGLARHLEG